MADLPRADTPAPAPAGRFRKAWDSDFVWSFRHAPVAVVSLVVVVLMVLAALLAPLIAPGPRPMSRAACTYSLFFSTSVAPRTTRANCTQSERPMARISTQIATWLRYSGGGIPLAMPKISMATRIAGKVSCTSATRMMIVSTQPPR
jgi:hypothetical protein